MSATRTPAPGPIRRVAILFSGGPAPAANAVISAAAKAFLSHDIEVLGIKYGYSKLIGFEPGRQLVAGEDYIRFEPRIIEGLRNTQGVLIGTARANPGKMVESPAHLQDPERVAPLRAVHAALCSLEVDALISIGGDDTLKTANKFQRMQDYLPEGSKRIRVVHLPKTIDNDYEGIDFTFGYFTAVNTLADEMHTLLHDAEASKAYFLCETMGRQAAWLAYGAAIASEASLVIGLEDITGEYRGEEKITDPQTGQVKSRAIMNLDAVVKRIVQTMRTREEREGKEFGVIVVAEGLAEMLSNKVLSTLEKDPHGHVAIMNLNLARMLATEVAAEYQKQTQRKRKVTGLQLGYESRCARPHAFDIMLGSQLGVGAYRALVEHNADGVMVSVAGQLDLHYVPFERLVDPKSLVTLVRYIRQDSDFHKLARFLETRIEECGKVI
jgi:6-phosphofructokinase 1